MGNIIITSYTGGLANVRIPDAIDSSQVTGIDRAFAENTTLTSIRGDHIFILGDYDEGTFESCSELITAIFPNCSYIARNTFNRCSKLTTISFPKCSYIGAGAFNECSSLTTATFPNCSYLDGDVFDCCDSLLTVSFPKCTYIGDDCFYHCIALTTASFPNCSYIGHDAFSVCEHLSTLYFLSTKLVTLSDGAFNTWGDLQSIYVRSSLLASYKTAKNWSDWSSILVGM